MNPTTLLTGLGTAVAADPQLGAAGTSGRDATLTSGDLFLSLVAGLLQGDTPVEGQPHPTGAATTPATPALPVATDDATSDPGPATDASSPTADGSQLAMLPITLALTPLTAQPVTAAAPAAARTAATDGSVSTVGEPATPATPATPLPGPTPGGSQSGRAGADPGGQQAADADQTGAAAPARPTTDPSTTSGPPQTDARVAAVPVPATTAAPATVAVAPTATPLAVATPTPTTTDLPRVADQVFPEVLRVAADPGTGTSRVTVRLNPESLGEVRVVLTHRRGELEVSLAGGSDARRALTEGTPELRRLLESVGRPDSRIVIRDLPNGPGPSASAATGPASAGPSTRTDVSTDLAGGSWSGAGRPGGGPAADRDSGRPHQHGSTTATDGIPDPTAPSRPTTTARRGHAGLDLSM